MQLISSDSNEVISAVSNSSEMETDAQPLAVKENRDTFLDMHPDIPSCDATNAVDPPGDTLKEADDQETPMELDILSKDINETEHKENGNDVELPTVTKSESTNENVEGKSNNNSKQIVEENGKEENDNSDILDANIENNRENKIIKDVHTNECEPMEVEQNVETRCCDQDNVEKETLDVHKESDTTDLNNVSAPVNDSAEEILLKGEDDFSLNLSLDEEVGLLKDSSDVSDENKSDLNNEDPNAGASENTEVVVNNVEADNVDSKSDEETNKNSDESASPIVEKSQDEGDNTDTHVKNNVAEEISTDPKLDIEENKETGASSKVDNIKTEDDCTKDTECESATISSESSLINNENPPIKTENNVEDTQLVSKDNIDMTELNIKMESNIKEEETISKDVIESLHSEIKLEEDDTTPVIDDVTSTQAQENIVPNSEVDTIQSKEHIDSNNEVDTIQSKEHMDSNNEVDTIQSKEHIGSNNDIMAEKQCDDEPMVLSDDESDVNDIDLKNKDNNSHSALDLNTESNESIKPVEDANTTNAECSESTDNVNTSKQQTDCVTVDDEDDDIVCIEDTSKAPDSIDISETAKTTTETWTTNDSPSKVTDAASGEPPVNSNAHQLPDSPTKSSLKSSKEKVDIPICPLTIMKQLKPKLSVMSRDDLEEFIVVKIVESISGRSAISDIQMKLKAQEKSTEEWKKKVMALTKQNRDLSIVLRNLCEEQQKRLVDNPLPIKITRSVGLQVGYPSVKPTPSSANVPIVTIGVRQRDVPNKQPTKDSPKATISPVAKPVATPVANVSGRHTRSKTQTTPVVIPTTPQTVQIATPVVTTVPPPSTTAKGKKPVVAPKLLYATQQPLPSKQNVNNQPRSVIKATDVKAEKRPAVQSIDLTDDEPPAKIPAIRTPPRPTPLIRPVNTNQLTNAKIANVINPINRPMYIPITAHGQNVQQNSIVVNRGKVTNKVVSNFRQIAPSLRVSHPIQIRPTPPQHPAPLPQSINYKVKYNQEWKMLPPKPNLKIARVDNGIVISWEMDEFSEHLHEAIASYQIFAYQEASTQPTTDLWKKIGDVKALPLPMACTLTHFMAGFKYYFAVRAIDVKSRVGAFSAPGQITLVNNKK